MAGDMNCEAAMKRLEAYSPRSFSDLTKPILKAFLEFLPSVQGRTNLEQAIATTVDDIDLYKLYERVFDNIILPVKARDATPCPTPPILPGHLLPSNHKPTRTFNSTPYGQLRRLCIRRDAGVCYGTKGLEFDTPENSFDAPAEVMVPVRDPPMLEIAHILNPLIFSTKDRMPRVWSTYIWLFPELEQYNGLDCTDPTNLLSLDKYHVHEPFTALKIAFDELDQGSNDEVKVNKNEPQDCTSYKLLVFQDGDYHYTEILRAFPSLLRTDQKRIVHFRPSTDTPMPNPLFLSIHATLAKIVHAAKAWDRIEDALQTFSPSRIALEEDGSTDLECVLKIAILRNVERERLEDVEIQAEVARLAKEREEIERQAQFEGDWEE